jgi:transcription initiation factor IIE alpha subunit
MKKREINGREIVEDIRLGLTDDEMMEKYRISTQGLRSLFIKLYQAGLITNDDMEWRPSLWDETVTLDLSYLSDPADTTIKAQPFIRMAGAKR